MTAKHSNDELSQALLGFVTDGSFPDSEDIVSAQFPANASSSSLKLISGTREQVQREICALSQKAAPDVDGWISQAKQLHADIERSRVAAREIVLQHEKGLQFRHQVKEAEERRLRIQNEIELTRNISQAFEEVRTFERKIALGNEALELDEHHRAFELLQELEGSLETTSLPRNSHVLRILSAKCSDLRSSLGECLRQRWKRFAVIDFAAGQMTVAADTSDSRAEMEELLSDLSHLELFEDVIDSFQHDFVSTIINPLLPPNETDVQTVSVEGNTLRTLPHYPSSGVADVLQSILTAFQYLRQHLPLKVVDRLLLHLFPAFSSELITKRIAPAVPIDVAAVDQLEQLVTHVTRFARTLEDEEWRGVEDIFSWADQVPRMWLNQRRAKSLDDVRSRIMVCDGKTSTVERVEKEQVSKHDDMFVDNNAEDDWDARWSQDGDDDNGPPAEAKNEHEDEDLSAWDADDDIAIPSTDHKEDPAEEEEEEEDGDEAWGWGWGDNKDDEPSAQAPKSPKRADFDQSAGSSSPREMTLREFYEVTDIPTSVLSIVTRQVEDAKTLEKPENSKLKIATSGPALFALPTLIIAIFKAISPLIYPQKFNGGLMLLYNDSMYLAEQLRSLSETHNISKLKTDIESVQRFGRMAYAKEMQAQRTILTDLLDGCQGFMNCAAQPFLGECENSIASTVDRLRDVKKGWEPILSRSALLQSIGSLLATVIDKIIIDVEDLSDISDAQSQRLAEFCNTVSKLEDIFLPDQPPDQDAATATEQIPMTTVYVSGWLKFQYLINILEGTLADIKFLWSEGGLKHDFSEEEVADLIRALFADSDHRKRALAEIRESSNDS